MRLWKAAALTVGGVVVVVLATTFFLIRNGVASLPFGTALVSAVADSLSGEHLQSATGQVESSASSLGLTSGVASGDVTATSAVAWARANGPSEISIEFWDESAPDVTRTMHTGAIPERDYAGSVRLDGLAPDTTYLYRVWAEGTDGAGLVERSEPAFGRFRTAPEPSVRREISFVFSGDLGGAGYCRRADSGYAIFAAMRELRPDFFIAMGDMIYADNTCPAARPDGAANQPGGFPNVASRAVDWMNLEQVREVYFRHWRYHRADEHLRALLSQIPMYALWDDHEVVNDSGASWSHHSVTDANRAGYATLVAAARDALFAYNPLARDTVDPSRLYRHVRWGADLDLFLLDTRSYRSRNDLADTAEHQKTMLGREQLQWLKAGLSQSTATWKVVASTVPLSMPTGGVAAVLYGRDGWANGASWDFSSQTGFERELLDLLASLDQGGVGNVVFLSGDVHQAAQIRYLVDLNGDGRALLFHELIAGPLSSSIGRPQQELDPTLHPTLLFREGGLFNFGYVRVQTAADGMTHLVAEVRNAEGQVLPGSRLDLTPIR